MHNRATPSRRLVDLEPWLPKGRLPHGSRPVLGAALALVLISVTSLSSQAQAPSSSSAPKSPVEALDQALKILVVGSDKAEVERRRMAVDRAITDISTFGDAAQALLLYSWGNDEKGSKDDLEARQRLLQRFTSGVEVVVKKGELGTRAALATLIGEFAVSVRADLSGSLGGSRIRVLQQSLPDLAAQLKDMIQRDQRAIPRAAAARALGKLRAGPADTNAALAIILKDTSAPLEARLAAAEALLSLTQPPNASDRSAQAQPSLETTHERDLADFGSGIIPTAILGLRDQDGEVRHLSARSLEQLAAGLTTYLRYGDSQSGGTQLPAVRRDERVEERLPGVVTAIFEAAPALAEALKDENPAIRAAAARALEELGEIRQRWRNFRPTAPVKGEALLDHASLQFVNYLEQGSGEPKTAVKLLASVIDPLLERLGDSDLRVRLAAVDALETITTRRSETGPEKELGQEVLLRTGQALTRSLSDTNRFVRWAALRTLGKLGPIENVKSGAVAAMIRLLSDPDQDVREASGMALERYGEAAAAAVPALAKAVNAGDDGARQAAMKALIAVGPAAEGAVPALAEALADRNVRLRRGAAEALSRINSPVTAANTALHKALSDSDAEVRRFASLALLKDQSLPR